MTALSRDAVVHFSRGGQAVAGETLVNSERDLGAQHVDGIRSARLRRAL
ncbi:hypothetical protein [Leifsonia sp. Root112D2]|nr:hypothetical protein [Leifsonia sp. Root112D2]